MSYLKLRGFQLCCIIVIITCHERVNRIARGDVRHTSATIQTWNISEAEAMPLGVIDNETFSTNWQYWIMQLRSLSTG